MRCVLKPQKPERFREVVANSGEQLRRNLKLTTLNVNLPPVKPEWRTPQPEELFRLLDEFEMRSSGADARKRYGGAAATPAPVAPKPQVATQAELFQADFILV